MTLENLVRVGLTVVLVACGGGSRKANPDLGTDLGPQDVDSGPPTIDTSLSANQTDAGDPVQVTCSGTGFDAFHVQVLVSKAEKGATTAGDDATPVSASVSLDPSAPPPAGVTIQGKTITITKAGSYAVACATSDGSLVDETPADLAVGPARAIAVDTKLSKNTVKTGEWVDATCTANDAYGNPVETAFAVVVTPPDGITVSGLSIQLTKVGNYLVACAAAESGVTDPTPESVFAQVNVPKKILTKVVPETFQAGGSAIVSCTVTDYYDNPVADLPVVVSIPAPMTISGKSITATMTGMYAVKCVPETIEWKYFQLFPVTVTVTPADPVRLDLKVVPDKPFYGVGETFTVTATAWDKFDNLVPNAVLGVPTVSPPGGIEPTPQNPNKVFATKAEGVYLMTFRLAEFPDVSADRTFKVEGSGPLLTITYPGRGETIAGKPSVTVMGTVKDEITGIRNFFINGKPLISTVVGPDGKEETSVGPSVQEDGSFTFIVNPVQGVNLITAEVENGAGMKYRTMRAFQFSFAYYPMDAAHPETGMVNDPVRAFLGKDFFDDGVHDPSHPDDLATILETFIGKLNIGALIPSPVASAGNYKIYIQNVKYGKPTLQIKLYDDKLGLDIVIPNLSMDVKLKGHCPVLGIDLCPDFSGDVSVNKVKVAADVKLYMDANKKIKAQMTKSDVSLDGIDIDVNGILGWLFDWLIDILVDQFTGTIEKAIEQQMASMINKTIEDVFSKFEIKQTFDIPALPGGKPTSINLWIRPAELKVRPSGVTLGLDATAYAPQGVSHDVLGSISRANCLTMKMDPFVLPDTSEIAFGAFDDLLNRAIFAVWWSGALMLTITSQDIPDADLTQYGVENLSVKPDFYLPPILTDCNPEGALQAQVGDLYVDASLDFNGIPLHIGAFVDLTASAELSLIEENGEKKVAIALKSLDLFEIEIVSINEELAGSEDGLIQLLKDQLVPKLTEGVFGKPLFSMAIPAIDLATLDPSLPPGLELKFAIEALFRDKGFTVVQGHLE